jgi:hypothetical protein
VTHGVPSLALKILDKDGREVKLKNPLAYCKEFFTTAKGFIVQAPGHILSNYDPSGK